MPKQVINEVPSHVVLVNNIVGAGMQKRCMSNASKAFSQKMLLQKILQNVKVDAYTTQSAAKSISMPLSGAPSPVSTVIVIIMVSAVMSGIPNTDTHTNRLKKYRLL